MNANNEIYQKYSNHDAYNRQFGNVSHEMNNIYSLRNDFGLYFECEKIKYLIKLLNQENISLVDKKILDVGCHYGFHLNLMAYLKGSADGLHGIDIIDKYIDVAQRINASIDFRTMDIMELKSERYEFIQLVYVLSEIFPEEFRLKFVEQISKLQQPGDYIYIVNFKALPPILYFILNTIIRVLKLPINIKLTRERNLDDKLIKKLFSEYRLVRSYTSIFLPARELYSKLHIPIGVIKVLGSLIPIHRYYFALLKKNY